MNTFTTKLCQFPKFDFLTSATKLRYRSTTAGWLVNCTKKSNATFTKFGLVYFPWIPVNFDLEFVHSNLFQ